MTLAAFVAQWKASTLNERSAAQQHFLGLCDALGQPHPAAIDPTGDFYAFEKGASKTSGGQGFADVWRKGFFAIEYKGKKKNLADAYRQLLEYREALANPPLLVVCDLSRFEIHTNFTGTVPDRYGFDLDDLLQNEPTRTCPRRPVEVLRALFEDPDRLRPERTTAAVTEAAARAFGQIARSLAERGHEPHAVAHFLIRLLFCLFAEDVGLLPEGLFTQMATNFQRQPERFKESLRALFEAMAGGGVFGATLIRHFNGGLFDDGEVLPLTEGELATLNAAAALDWAHVEPSIFGTLFERSLDPGKRSQLGAHYTSRDDIEKLVEPVILMPLRRRWDAVQIQVEAILGQREPILARQQPGIARSAADRRALERIDADARDRLQTFTQEIAALRVLDPACGSGNFLYVALRALLDLEKAAIAFGASRGLTGFFPQVGPEQMRGLEVNEYAVELAPTTVWIGYIQWLRENGFGGPEEPILRRFDMIRQQDAILNPDGTEPDWPEADFIVGNPPFLGDKKMRAELGDGYVERLRRLYAGRVPGGADLVCYWFEKARAQIASGRIKRAGLICTNGIRFGANRQALTRIAESGSIFSAWSDREWILDGAAVRVSIVGFDDGAETQRTLDGQPVPTINPDLSWRPDVTTAAVLRENAGLVYLGMMKAGPFDLSDSAARAMLSTGGNPNGRPNSDVVRPRLGGQDITGRPRGGYVIDFGERSEEEASLYEAPFEYVRQHVKPLRDANRDDLMQQKWWLFGRPRPALRAAIAGRDRCIVTPEVAKHRLFVWMPTTSVPDHSCHVIAREDDYFFGVLHSRLHEVWSLAVCNFMGIGNDPRYNSSRTFGTFPMPWPPGQEPTEEDSPTVKAISEAARKLVELRDNWLSPEGMDAADLKKRTLTNLYNARPTWLDNAHKALDRAVLAAYAQTTGDAWPETMNDEEILGRLLWLNHQRAGRGGEA